MRTFSQSPYRNSSQYSNKHNPNYRTSIPKYQRQINQVIFTDKLISDPPGLDNTEASEIHLSHIHCETTYDKSGTENTLIFKMLKKETDYETPSDSNFYQKEVLVLMLKNEIKIWKTQVTLHI